MKQVFQLACALLFSLQYSLAQNSPPKTVDDFIKNCQAIINSADGKAASFASLIDIGNAGLSKTTSNDYSSKCQLNNFVAIGYYNQFKFDSAKKYFERTYTYSLKSGRGDNGAYALGALIQIYHYLNENNKSDSVAKLLQPVLDTSTNNVTKCSGYYALGKYHANIKSFFNLGLNDFIQSLLYLKPLIDTASSPKYKVQFSITTISIVDIYLLLKQPEKALQYLFSANQYAAMAVTTEVGILCRYVKTYTALKKIDSALQYQNLLNQAVAKAPKAWSELVTSNIAIASYYLDRGEIEAAKIYIDSATARAAVTTKMLESQADAISGRYYSLKKNNILAKEYYEKAVTVIYNVDRESYCDIRKELALLAIEAGDVNEAKKQLTLYTQANDSLTNEKTSNNLAEMEAQYQNKDKQQQIDFKDRQLLFAKRQQLWLIAGLILAGIAAILLILLYRNKKRSANLINEKNTTLSKLNTDLEEANRTKAKLFSIISHDLRSPISQVYQFLKLQQLNPQLLNEQQKNELSNKIQTATGSLLETMEDLLLWSKTQMSEFKTVMQSTHLLPVVNACQALLQLNSEAKNIQYKKEISGTLIIITDPYYLQTIIRNLLQNAVKASPENGEIEIGTWQSSYGLVLYIQNQGNTFTQQDFNHLISSEENTKSLNGLGLRLVDELSKKIGASIVFKSPEKGGTRAEIHLSGS
ncbi:MAG: HAMP domain-containing sensor histidine kinase [Bacteroidota bacterium]|nr:HAMP domain-containing sensor histidine kinase [Bacteroidota bacterium]